MADVFKDEFVPNIEGSSGHPKWVRANPGEAGKWATFRDAAIAHKKGNPPVAVPSMATRYGKALIAAGKEHMSVTDLGAVWVPPVTEEEPPAIAGQGYSLVFEDNFDGPDLDLTTWVRAGWPGYQTTPLADAVVGNSILTISSRRADGYPNRNVSTRITPPGQVGTGEKWNGGYYEMRSKWPSGKGAWPAFWMFSDYWVQINGNRNLTPPYVAEIDILEAAGGLYLDKYNHVVHSNTGGNGTNDPADVFAPTGSGQFASPNIGNLTLGYHTYACKHTSTTVSFYCDDIFLASCPVFAQSTNQDLFMILSMWVGKAGDWVGSYDATTPNVLTHQIDWVKVWQQV